MAKDTPHPSEEFLRRLRMFVKRPTIKRMVAIDYCIRIDGLRAALGCYAVMTCVNCECYNTNIGQSLCLILRQSFDPREHQLSDAHMAALEFLTLIESVRGERK